MCRSMGILSQSLEQEKAFNEIRLKNLGKKDVLKMIPAQKENILNSR